MTMRSGSRASGRRRLRGSTQPQSGQEQPALPETEGPRNAA